MSIPKPQRSSSDIEMPVLTSHALSIQPPPERVPFSSPISEANSEHPTAANSTAMVDEVALPALAYFPPLNCIPPIQSSDAGLLEYTQLHGRSEIPLSPRQPEDAVRASEASIAEALPAYVEDNPPRYSLRLRRNDSGEPLTWPAISFRIGFRTSFHTKVNEISVNSHTLSAFSAVFPLFWFFGALTLITPQGSLDRIFMPWFKDFAPSASTWLDTLETEEEKEEYLARMRVSEIRWAKYCLIAFSILMLLIVAAVGTVVGVSRMQ
jgi:hypothetical protein